MEDSKASGEEKSNLLSETPRSRPFSMEDLMEARYAPSHPVNELLRNEGEAFGITVIEPKKAGDQVEYGMSFRTWARYAHIDCARLGDAELLYRCTEIAPPATSEAEAAVFDYLKYMAVYYIGGDQCFTNGFSREATKMCADLARKGLMIARDSAICTWLANRLFMGSVGESEIIEWLEHGASSGYTFSTFLAYILEFKVESGDLKVKNDIVDQIKENARDFELETYAGEWRFSDSIFINYSFLPKNSLVRLRETANTLWRSLGEEKAKLDKQQQNQAFPKHQTIQLNYQGRIELLVHPSGCRCEGCDTEGETVFVHLLNGMIRGTVALKEKDPITAARFFADLDEAIAAKDVPESVDNDYLFIMAE